MNLYPKKLSFLASGWPKKIIIRSLRAGLILLIFAFMAWNLAKNYNEISDYEWQFNYYWLILSSLLSIGVAFSMAAVWQSIIQKYAPSLSWQQFMMIWFKSLLAKYLPGGFWNVVGRIYLCREANVTGVAPALSIALEILLFSLSQIITIFVLGSFFVSELADLPLRSLEFTWVATFLVSVVLIVALTFHPKIFFQMLYGLVGKQEKIVEFPPIRYDSLLIWLGSYVLINVGNGVAFFIFIISIYALPLSLLPATVVMLNFAVLVGFLTPLSPNGLGVREGLLAVLLGGFMPLPIAITISLAARVWFTISEIVSIGLGSMILRLSARQETSQQKK